MIQLNASTLPSISMARGVAPKTERVIQFGEGGFLDAQVMGNDIANVALGQEHVLINDTA